MTAQLLSGADGLRRELYALAARSSALRAVLIDRRRRLLAISLLAASLSFVLALRFPLLSLWLGAAILGVPHIAGGIRHAAVHRSLSKPSWFAVAVVFAVSVFHLATSSSYSRWTWTAVAVSMCGGVAAEVVTARRARWLLIPLAALALLISRRPLLTLMVLTHVHAFGSVLFFILAARQKRQPALAFALSTFAIVAAAAVGLLDSAMPQMPFIPESARASLLGEIYGLAPGLSGEQLKRLVFIYAFGQSLHYAIWIRLMPELDRPTPVPKPFRAQLALLRRDFGRTTLPIFALCIGATALLLFEGSAARETYFALGFFHFTLEGAALTRLALGGGRARHPSARSV